MNYRNPFVYGRYYERIIRVDSRKDLAGRGKHSLDLLKYNIETKELIIIPLPLFFLSLNVLGIL